MFPHDVNKLLSLHSAVSVHIHLLTHTSRRLNYFISSFLSVMITRLTFFFTLSMLVWAFLIKCTSKNCQKWQFCGARPVTFSKMVTHYCQNGNKIIHHWHSTENFSLFFSNILLQKKRKEKNKRLKNGNYTCNMTCTSLVPRPSTPPVSDHLQYTLTSMLPCELAWQWLCNIHSDQYTVVHVHTVIIMMSSGTLLNGHPELRTPDL